MDQTNNLTNNYILPSISASATTNPNPIPMMKYDDIYNYNNDVYNHNDIYDGTSEKDVELVMTQLGDEFTKEQVIKSIKENNGDIVSAIMALQFND